MIPYGLAAIIAGEAECQASGWPDEWEFPPITPEMIEADERLTDDEKAIAYDLLFEYHGDDEEEEDSPF